MAICTILAALLAVATGCGDSQERFSDQEADRALAALDAMEAAAAEGRCTVAQSRVRALIGQAQTINKDRPELGAAYAESLDRLQALVEAECDQRQVEPTEPVTGETGETAEPTGTTSEPTPPEPTGSPEPTTPTPEPTPPTPPEDQSGGVQPE